MLFCTEKQETDKLLMSGAEHKVPKPTPLRGQPLYFDPNDVQLQLVKRHRRADLQQAARRQQAQQYQEMLRTIPAVEYFPTTRLAKMQLQQQQRSSASATGLGNSVSLSGGGGGGGGDRDGAGDGTSEYDSSALRVNSGSSLLAETQGEWQNVERDMKAAMRAAKAGNSRALYEFNMRRRQLSPVNVSNGNDSIISNSPGAANSMSPSAGADVEVVE